MDRFLRTRRLYGDNEFAKLIDHTVMIVGLGAVGGYAFEGLVRSGIKRLIIVDFDRVGMTNINRQILATDATMGRSKVEVAKERALSINPDVQIQTIDTYFNYENSEDLLSLSPDLIVDAIDSVGAKVTLLSEAYKKNIPIFSSMGAALKTDPTKVQIADLMDTEGCPLARVIRRKLRRRGIGKGITCVYSPEVINYEYRPPEEEGSEFLKGPPRRTLGSLASLTGIFGFSLATSVIDYLRRA
ncbi:tRNA threonylcarbamoyladenosine dehydratase [Spirochaeta cellobiosiphila]|uniref:tRNA threonylcarbamoyladenosine dehydratase n=1 Tax=Spirochaeta cellobiosiphila TaxID=504483 RepID=UPI00040A3F3E|nr:tRNA threonylcarbamoyladenosine dehydratase [Spirochaeta cellobiosiphila]